MKNYLLMLVLQDIESGEYYSDIIDMDKYDGHIRPIEDALADVDANRDDLIISSELVLKEWFNDVGWKDSWLRDQLKKVNQINDRLCEGL